MEFKELPTDQVTDVAVEEKEVVNGAEGAREESSVLQTNKETSDKEPDAKDETSEDTETTTAELENQNGTMNIGASSLDSVVGVDDVEQSTDPNVTVDPKPDMETANGEPQNYPHNAAAEAQEDSEATKEESNEESLEKVDAEKLHLAKEEPIEDSSEAAKEESSEKVDVNLSSETTPSNIVDTEKEEHIVPPKPKDEVDKVKAAVTSESVNDTDMETVKEVITDLVPEIAEAQEDSEATKEESVEESLEKVDVEKQHLAKEEPIEESSEVAKEESSEKVDANPSSETMPSDIVGAKKEENAIPPKLEDEVDNAEAALTSESVNDTDTEKVKEAITGSVPETAEAQEDSEATKEEPVEESSEKVDVEKLDLPKEEPIEEFSDVAKEEYSEKVDVNPSSETMPSDIVDAEKEENVILPKSEAEVDKVEAVVSLVTSESVNDTDTETVKEAITDLVPEIADTQEDSEATKEQSIEESLEKVDAEKLQLTKKEPIEESSEVAKEESSEKADENPSSETTPSDIVDAKKEENTIPPKPEDEVDDVEVDLTSKSVNDIDTETVIEAITDSVPETTEAQEDSEATKEESIEESLEKVDVEKLRLAKEEPIEESSEKVDTNSSSETMPSDIIDAEKEENTIPPKSEDEVNKVEAAVTSESVNDTDSETIKEAITDSTPEIAEAREDSEATKEEYREEPSEKVDGSDTKEASEHRAVTDSVLEIETKLAEEPEAASDYTTSHVNPSLETMPKSEDEVNKVEAVVTSESLNDDDAETVKEVTTEVPESAEASVYTAAIEASDLSSVAEGVEELHDKKHDTEETMRESSKDEQDTIPTETDNAEAEAAEIPKADTSTLVAEAPSEEVITEPAAGIGEVSSKEKKTLEGFLLVEASIENLESGKPISANNSDVAPVTKVGPQEETASGGVEGVVGDPKPEEEKYSENTELLDAKKNDSLDLPHTDKEVKEEPANESGEAENKKEVEEEQTEKTVERDLVVEKKEEEVPKLDVSVKSSPRHSSNIFSKVKHSIGKVKKAIIGRSPGSKTLTAESKD